MGQGIGEPKTREEQRAEIRHKEAMRALTKILEALHKLKLGD